MSEVTINELNEWVEEAVKWGEYERTKRTLWLLVLAAFAILGTLASLNHGLLWFLVWVAAVSATVGIATMLIKGFLLPNERLAGLVYYVDKTGWTVDGVPYQWNQSDVLDCPHLDRSLLSATGTHPAQWNRSNVLDCPLCKREVSRRKLNEHLRSHRSIRKNNLAGVSGCLPIVVAAVALLTCKEILAGRDSGPAPIYTSVLGFAISVAIIRASWRMGRLIAERRSR
jgi:hypothetical protein